MAVIQQGRERELLGADQGSPLSKAMLAQAHRRGIPLLLPIMDLEDRRNIRVSDVWGGFSDPVMQASRRYAADNVLIAKIYQQSPGQWESSWTLVQEQDIQRWTYTGNDMEQAMASGMDGAGDILAARYAFHSNTQSQVLVQLSISNIDNLQAYAEVDRYLSNLPLVAMYKVNRVDADRVLYTLQIRGDLASLQQALSLENKLQVTAPPVVPLSGQPLRVNTTVSDPITGMPAPVVDAMPDMGQSAQANLPVTGPVVATSAPKLVNMPDTDQTAPVNTAAGVQDSRSPAPVVDGMPESVPETGLPQQPNITATGSMTGMLTPVAGSKPSAEIQILYYRLVM